MTIDHRHDTPHSIQRGVFKPFFLLQCRLAIPRFPMVRYRVQFWFPTLGASGSVGLARKLLSWCTLLGGWIRYAQPTRVLHNGVPDQRTLLHLAHQPGSVEGVVAPLLPTRSFYREDCGPSQLRSCSPHACRRTFALFENRAPMSRLESEFPSLANLVVVFAPLCRLLDTALPL